jgi:hypothetical protein
MVSEESTATESPCCKVETVLRRYSLETLDAELQRRWGDAAASASLRDLAREVNQQILSAVLAGAGRPPIDGETANLRRLLTDDDVSENQRVEAKRRLESDGVPVEEVLDDFVSHQTVYNHLRDCEGVTAPEGPGDEERLSSARSAIFGLQNRTERVAETTLSQLGSSGVISPESYDIVVDVQAICEECGRSAGIETLLSDGGCGCRSDGE